MKKRKFFTRILCLGLMVSLSSQICMAMEINGDLNLKEGAKPVIITKEDIRKENEKLSKLVNPKTTNYYKTLSVPVFQQETEYYCAPATVKQVLHYINGSSSSQGTYASLLGTTSSGTDMTVIPNLLNSKQSENQYIYSSVSNEGRWLDQIEASLNNYTPAIIDIDTRLVSWPYKTSGHFVNISGLDALDINSNGDTNGDIRITDPYVKGLGNKWYDIQTVFEANTDHWRSAIIW